MTKPRLHLDADTSARALAKALQERGHDVTRTPTSWMPLDASSELQLLGATAQGRILFTHNIRDFVPLAARYPRHAGIVLAAQNGWSPKAILHALDRMLSTTEAEEWIGQIHWLSRWR